ncbi:hypothetical protein COB11_00185 [Candidatus Aerophobetes bacterium]|uniref:TolC family protein n=1 Tax=Aerophobetes bacterium TaxID=2030807 RepID=A0A2A4YMP9_UNCAE|nr:MAG: hypothetical protein COB11_00185 [Candidatus Aerophobetes bacterium]
MKNKKLILSAFLCLALSSCGDYRGASRPYSYAPESAMSIWIPPKSIRKSPIIIDEVDPLELSSNDLTLAEIIDITLINNPLTKESWYDARAAAAKYGQSLAKYYILTDLDSFYENTRKALFSRNARIIQQEVFYGGELSATYTILDFGRRKATSSAAREALYEADFMHNRTLQEVVHTIMNDYYTYLSQIAQVHAAEQDVYRAQVSLDAVNDRFSQGTADIGDQAQAITKLMQQKLNLVTQKKYETTYYTELLSNMGMPANAYLTFVSYPEELQLFEIADLSKMIAMATKFRPDLLASEATVRSYHDKYDLAVDQKYPKVTGDFSFGRKYTNLGASDYYDYDATIKFTLPLFQGFNIQNNIKKARAELRSKEASLRDLQLELLQEVTAYYNDVLFSKESYAYAKEYLSASITDFKLNLEKYQMGTTNIVDLINAQTAVADAQYQLINSEKTWYTSIANLAYSTGVISNNPEEDVNLEDEGDLLNPCYHKVSDEKK